MSTCSNCGKVMGLHSSILQGCMCQYSMQAPPQRTWVGLTDEERQEIALEVPIDAVLITEAKLRSKNT